MKTFFTLIILTTTLTIGHASDEFPGWEGLRVIKSDYGTRGIVPIKTSPGEKESLLLVKSRQSRLDIYSHRGKPENDIDESALENPNYLPMAEDFEKTEISLTRPPHAACAYDVDRDGVDEIFVIQGAPLELVLLKKQKTGTWEKEREWEIANHKLTTTTPILIRPVKNGTQILISYNIGIQIIDFEKDDGIEWLQPREKSIKRSRWWLADLDNDGDQDLIETVNSTAMPLRWYEAEGRVFRPALSLSEDISNSKVTRLAQTNEAPQVVTLGVIQPSSISTYSLGQSEESIFGEKNLLPLSQLNENKWTVLSIKGTKSIVELGRDKPILNLYQEIDGFWQFQKEFPNLREAEQIIALGDKANSLYLRIKNDERIFKSTWDGGRFTFPKPIEEQDNKSKETKLLGFNQYGDDVWWIRQEDDKLLLHIHNAKKKTIETIVYPSIKNEYETGIWLGEKSLLLKKKFSKGTERMELSGDTATLLDSNIKVSDMSRIQFFDNILYIQNDGVVQVLDQDLEIDDQIMLRDDHAISSFAPVSPKKAYALEQDGKHLHIMEKDKTGIFRSEKRIEIPYTLALRYNPLLGLILIDSNYINLPKEGHSPELVINAHIDPNQDANRNYEKKTISNIFPIDIDGDGIDEIAAVDYVHYTITVYERHDSKLKEVISWKVFDDEKYPYGQANKKSSNTNPYKAIAMDLDGDHKQDLVLASHDRLVIYLAKEN